MMTDRVPRPIAIAPLRPAHPANDQDDTIPCLSVEQLEDGLRMLDRGDIEPNLFWDEKAATFRETIISAIDETSSALASREISKALRDELESQVEPLQFYLRIAETYLAGRRILH